MADEDGWTGPRRHDEAGLGRLLNVIKAQDQRIAALERGAALRGAGIRVSPDGMRVHSSLGIEGELSVTGDATVGEGGSIASADYDGTDHSNLGSSGWFLGSDEGGSSYLALNGLDVYETLQDQIAALPVVISESAQNSNWQATNGGTIASVSFTRPAGKTRVSVMAQMSGFYQADLNVPMSDRPSFRVVIGGNESPNMPRVPDNMDTYHLTGAFNREYNSGSTVTVRVRTITGNELSPAYPSNRIYLGALAIFT